MTVTHISRSQRLKSKINVLIDWWHVLWSWYIYIQKVVCLPDPLCVRAYLGRVCFPTVLMPSMTLPHSSVRVHFKVKYNKQEYTTWSSVNFGWASKPMGLIHSLLKGNCKETICICRIIWMQNCWKYLSWEIAADVSWSIAYGGLNLCFGYRIHLEWGTLKWGTFLKV